LEEVDELVRVGADHVEGLAADADELLKVIGALHSTQGVDGGAHTPHE
jgi:hypothetical protein